MVWWEGQKIETSSILFGLSVIVLCVKLSTIPRFDWSFRSPKPPLLMMLLLLAPLIAFLRTVSASIFFSSADNFKIKN